MILRFITIRNNSDEEIELEIEVKQPKYAVNYTNHAMVRSEKCSLCKHFRPEPIYKTSLCVKVQGSISPQGWCKLFQRNGSR